VCLPLLISPCTIKSRSSLLAPAHPGGPGKRAVKRLCVCVGGKKRCMSVTVRPVISTQPTSSRTSQTTRTAADLCQVQLTPSRLMNSIARGTWAVLLWHPDFAGMELSTVSPCYLKTTFVSSLTSSCPHTTNLTAIFKAYLDHSVTKFRDSTPVHSHCIHPHNKYSLRLNVCSKNRSA